MSSTVVTEPIGEALFSESSGASACSGVSTTPGATALNRMCTFAYSKAKLLHHRVQATLSDHGNGSRLAGNWIVHQRCSDARDAAAAPLRLHLFHSELGNVKEACKGTVDEATRVRRCILNGFTIRRCRRSRPRRRSSRTSWSRVQPLLRRLQIDRCRRRPVRDRRKLKVPWISSRLALFSASSPRARNAWRLAAPIPCDAPVTITVFSICSTELPE